MANVELSDESTAEEPETRLLSLRERTPADIERQVILISADSNVDELCAALDASDWLLARARTIDRLMKQIAIDWIDRNGEFAIGDNRYSVGFSVGVKCVDVPQTARAVLEAAGGDFDRFIEVLVAQPFKHASVRNVIGRKLHDSLFMAHRTGRLVNGVPERLLKRADTRFLPKPRGG